MLYNTLIHRNLMTSRDLNKELSYWVYNDPEYGDDITNLDYPALIGLLTELMSRVETLENETLPPPSWAK